MGPRTPGRGRADAGRFVLEEWEGEPVEAWRARWGVPRLEIFQTLGSTSDHLRQLSAEGAPPWTVVMAEAQSKGRGRGGKGWVSPMGMGLWLSLLIPSRSPDADALLPIRLGLAVTRALDAGPAEQGIAGPSPEIKWPNDILLANRKVGGILCEAAGSAGVVAGLGLNVRQKIEDFPPDLRGAAVSVEEATGRGVDRGALAGRILAEVMAGVPGGGERLSEGELGEWVRRDALRGMPVRSELVGTGVARGITPRGFLVLETGSGRDREVRAGSLIRLSR